MGIMPTKTELALEQTQQGVSDEVLNIKVILHSIHSDDGNPFNVNIKQALRKNITEELRIELKATGVAQLATNGDLGEVVTTCERSQVQVSPYGFSLKFEADRDYLLEQNGIKSVFVHVPLFLTIDEDTQMRFAASLLEVLASSYQ
nr:pyrrolidone-carboxylate peptidase-like [Tanacetum cinerariifolium]